MDQYVKLLLFTSRELFLEGFNGNCFNTFWNYKQLHPVAGAGWFSFSAPHVRNKDHMFVMLYFIKVYYK